MNSPIRQSQAWETDPKVLICLVTVPVSSRSTSVAYPALPAIGIYASMLPNSANRGDDGFSSRSATCAKVSLDQAVANGCRATRVASLSARQAERGIVTFGQAKADADAAERARTEAGELAIASALAQGDLLSVRIAILERQRVQAETRASVASLPMDSDVQVSTSTRTQSPMFNLVYGGALPRQSAVFKEDLVRLVAGQDVSLDSRDSTVRRSAPLSVE